MSGQQLLVLLIGLFGGVLSGLLGIGGGLFLIPVMVYFLGFAQQKAQGTTLAMLSLPVAFLGAWNYHKNGLVDWKVAFILGAGFVVGGYLGSTAAVKIPVKLMQQIFGILLILVGLKMALGK
jgi:uncharacterized membrane protein YfcA